MVWGLLNSPDVVVPGVFVNNAFLFPIAGFVEELNTPVPPVGFELNKPDGFPKLLLNNPEEPVVPGFLNMPPVFPWLKSPGAPGLLLVLNNPDPPAPVGFD